jgi:hypothetical protein
MHGIDLNDRGITGARDGEAIGSAAVEAAAGRHVADAYAPLLLQLAEVLPVAEDAGLWVAIAPPAPGTSLGELLGALRGAGYSVQGFADRAALLAATLGLSAPLVLPELSGQRFSISVADCTGEIAALRRHVPLPGGAAALQGAWLELARATLVQQTRFDPLHDLRHETALRAQLPQLVATAQREGQASTRIETGADALTLTLTRDQLAAAAAPVLREFAAALQSLSAASSEAVLLVPESLPGLPGFEAVLASAHFARLYRIADGLAARAASLLSAAAPSAQGGVPYRTQLPRFATSLPEALAPYTAAGHEPQAMATHVVYRGRVLPIPPAGLVIGRDPGDAPGLRLPEGIAGLSRRHCTLRREGGRSQVIDHSTHGSWLDGARVRGRALLAAGSVLKVGEPGIELALVSLDPAAE